MTIDRRPLGKIRVGRVRPITGVTPDPAKEPTGPGRHRRQTPTDPKPADGR